MAENDVIQEGDQVVFRRESSTRVFQIRKNRQIYFEKSKFDVNDLIGEPYGSAFEIDRGKLVKMDKEKVEQSQIPEPSAEAGTDNRNLLDLDSNQKMSKEEIMKMKDEGVTGGKIIEALIENSETFHSKTEFSQAKFLKKKKKKHVLVFTVLRPTPRLVMEIFAKDPAKICYLRPDSLSQALSYSNVMFGSRVVVVETCQGLLLACLLQRIGDAGKLIQLIPNSTNAVCRQAMEYFGYKKDNMDNVFTFPLDELVSLSRPSTQAGNNGSEQPAPSLSSSLVNVNNSSRPEDTKDDVPSESVCKMENASNTERGESDETAESNVPKVDEKSAEGSTVLPEPVEGDKDSSVSGGGEKEMEDDKDAESCAEVDTEETKTGDKEDFVPNREIQRIRRAARQKEAGDMIREKQIDSLVIACKYNPTPILMRMLEFLPPSKSVVVYCQFLEPLVECYSRVKERHSGLQLKLSETWMREYQILPQRTHPMMNMSGTGGYLLTFITCDPRNSQEKQSP